MTQIPTMLANFLLGRQGEQQSERQPSSVDDMTPEELVQSYGGPTRFARDTGHGVIQLDGETIITPGRGGRTAGSGSGRLSGRQRDEILNLVQRRGVDPEVASALYAGTDPLSNRERDDVLNLVQRRGVDPGLALRLYGADADGRDRQTRKPTEYEKVMQRELAKAEAADLIERTYGERRGEIPNLQFQKAQAELEDVLLGGGARTPEGDPVDPRQLAMQRMGGAPESLSEPLPDIPTNIGSAGRHLGQEARAGRLQAIRQRNQAIAERSAEEKAFNQALDRHVEVRAERAASDYLQLTKAASDPSILQGEVEAIRQQWEQSYPEYAHMSIQPMSPEQIAKMERGIELDQHRDFYEEQGYPRWVVSGIDENGNPETPHLDQYLRSEDQRIRVAKDAENSERKFFLEMARDLKDTIPEPLPPFREYKVQERRPDMTLEQYQQESARRQQEIEDQREQWRQLVARATGYNPRAERESVMAPPQQRQGVTRRAMRDGRPVHRPDNPATLQRWLTNRQVNVGDYVSLPNGQEALVGRRADGTLGLRQISEGDE